MSAKPTWSLLVLVQIWFILWPCLSRTDHVTSSTHKMTSLVQREQKLLRHLSQIASAAQLPAVRVSREKVAALNKTISALRKKLAPVERFPDVLQHPVAAFRFIQRLVADWDHVTQSRDERMSEATVGFIESNLRDMRQVISKWLVWPTQSSLENAALGLVRIGHVYSLYPSPPNIANFSHKTGDRSKRLHSSPKHSHDENDNYLDRTSALRNSRSLYDFQTSSANFIPSRVDKEWWSLSSKHTGHPIDWLPSLCDGTITRLDHRDKNDKTPLDVNDCIYSSQLRAGKKGFMYEFLTPEDLRFIGKVARDNEYCEEAKIWFDLAKLSASRLGHRVDSDDAVSIVVERMELDQRHPIYSELPTQECHGNKDSSPHVDHIQRNYIDLCKSSTEATFMDSGQNERCQWRYIWPYERFREEIVKSDPEISRFYDVISSRDIEHIKLLASDKLSASELPSNLKAKVKDLRVSQTAWLPNETPALQKLSNLVGQVTGLDTGLSQEDTPSEMFQVVNYGLGGLYAPHEDSVRTSRKLRAETSAHLKNSGDRMATWMFYLSDVQLGGATVFPALNISVAPIKGSAVLWYNLLKNGEADTRLVHAGCPVVVGDKWVANKWIRERSQVFRRPCSLDPHQ